MTSALPENETPETVLSDAAEFLDGHPEAVHWNRQDAQHAQDLLTRMVRTMIAAGVGQPRRASTPPRAVSGRGVH